jgi:hypothetical protein
VGFFQPPAPGLVDAVRHEAKLLAAMGVCVDRDLHADLSRPKDVQVVQVEAVGLGVQLDGHVVFFSSMKDFF